VNKTSHHSLKTYVTRKNRVQRSVNCQEFNGCLKQQFLVPLWDSGLPEMMPCNYHLWGCSKDVYQNKTRAKW